MKPLSKKFSAFLRSYYKGPDHPLKVRLWNWFRRMSAYPRLTVPYGSGGWITVDERCLVQREIFDNSLYEPEVWQALSACATGDEVVWDVGAHIGSFSIQALLDKRVREVHAFEPDPAQAEILRMNLALNGGRSTVHPCALSYQKIKMPLHRGPKDNTGLSSLVFQVSGNRCDVECLMVDDLVFQRAVPSPTLVKIDVEGWELEVLWGAERLLSEAPPKAIIFETEWDESEEMPEDSPGAYLKEFGYQMQRIQRPNGLVEPRENFLARLIKGTV